MSEITSQSGGLVTEKWTSNMGFILAMAGSAIGLSNIWKFSYSMGSNGGSAFLFCYLVATIFFAIPGIIAEIVIGRNGAANSPIDSTRNIIEKSGGTMGWLSVYGGMAFVTALVLLSYYSVIGGWAVGYTVEAAKGFIPKLENQDQSFGIFISMITHPVPLYLCALTVLIPTIVVVAMGIEKGIERYSTIFVLFMILISLLMLAFAVVSPGFVPALKYMFVPDFSKIKPAVVVDAVGQAFFTVSVGVCTIVVYGAMMGKQENIIKNSLWIATLNTLFSLVIGISIFSLVFSKGVNPAAGPSLVFGVFPLILKEMPGSTVLGVLFFAMIYFAALTSAFSMLEVPVKLLMGKGMSRVKAALSTGIVTVILAIAPTLGFNVWGNVRLLPIGLWKDMQILDVLDYFVSNISMPINAVLLFIILGWKVSAKVKSEELGISEDSATYKMLDIIFKYLGPICVGIIVPLALVGFIKF